MNALEQIGLAVFSAFVQLCIGIAVLVGGTEIVKRLDTIKHNTDGTLQELRRKNEGLQDDKDVLVKKVHTAETKPATRKRKK